MSDISINFTSLNEEDVIPILLEALKVASTKTDSLKQEIAKVKGDLDIKLQQLQDAMNESKNLNSTMSLLRKDLEDARTSVENQKSELSELSNKYLKIKEQADTDAKEIESLKTANSKLSDKLTVSKEQINQKSLECQGKVKQLEAEYKQQRTELQDTFNEEKRVLFIKMLTICSTPLSDILPNIDRDNYASFYAYVNYIIESIQILNEKSINITNLKDQILKADGIACHVANLMWWLNNKDVSDCMKYILDDITGFKRVISTLFEAIELVSGKISIPSEIEFTKNTEGYSTYKNAYSDINKIFPKLKVKEDLMCQIYKVSCDGEDGKCYISEG